MRWLLLVAILMTVGCSKGGDSSSPPPAPDPGLGSGGGSVPLCSVVQRCTAQCFSYYPYRTRQAVLAECSSRGFQPTDGICVGLLNDNQRLIDQYNACAANPVTYVITWP